MKKSMGKTDSLYAVKRRGDTKENWGLCIMESWLRKFLGSAALVRLYFPAPNLLLKVDELLKKERQFKYRAQGIQDAYILEAGLVEVVVGSQKKSAGLWVLVEATII